MVLLKEKYGATMTLEPPQEPTLVTADFDLASCLALNMLEGVAKCIPL